MITESDADFSIAISAARPDRCSADHCSAAPTLLVTICYCYCPVVDREHGHPGSTDPSADRSTVPVCERHGAIIAHTWECFERLENDVAAGGAA